MASYGCSTYNIVIYTDKDEPEDPQFRQDGDLFSGDQANSPHTLFGFMVTFDS